MASSNPQSTIITYGTENELLLVPKYPSLAPEKGLGKDGVSKMSPAFNTYRARHDPHGFMMTSRSGRGAEERTFDGYTISTEGTLEMSSSADPAMFGGELITPVFSLMANATFAADHKKCFGWIHEHYKVTSNASCSTHVHVSIKNRGFSLQEAINVAVCALVFEPAILALVPTHRHANQQAKSNWANNDWIGALAAPGSGADGSRGDCVARIARRQSMEELVQLLCPDGTKQWATNYLNLLTEGQFREFLREEGNPADIRACNKPLGTIEFRLAPASQTYEELGKWREFWTCFVQSAILTSNPAELLDTAPTVGNLRKFVENPGVPQGPGLNDFGLMKPLWTAATKVCVLPMAYEGKLDDGEKKALYNNLEIERGRIQALITQSQ